MTPKMLMLGYYLVLIMSAAIAVAAALNATAGASFTPNAGFLTFDQLGGKPYNVSYDYRAITINGQRVYLLSAGVHYPRSSPSMWPQMFQRIRASGLNNLQTYFFHNYHERVQGVWDWSTEARDLGYFLRLAAKYGVFVTLRIGIYVDAEWHNGGVALWTRGQNFQYRRFNPGWINYMGTAVRSLSQYIEPYLAKNGGPIIITQIENEDGGEGTDPDKVAYFTWMEELVKDIDLGTVWIMCSGGTNDHYFISTCNGGGTGCADFVPGAQAINQPGMMTENWVAWFESWGGSPYYTDATVLSYGVADFAAAGGVYQNYYMYHGGSNFGIHPSDNVVTSYDYDGQLDEYGVPNEPKYTHLSNLHHVLSSLATTFLGYNYSIPVPMQWGVTLFQYGTIGQSDCVVAFRNSNKSAVDVTFSGHSFRVSNQSVQFYDGNFKLLFDTSVVTSKSIDNHQSAVKLPAQSASSIRWYAEPVGIWSGVGISSRSPLDQIDTSLYKSPYMWYSTRLYPSNDDIASGVNLTLSNAGDSEMFFSDDVYAGRGDGSYSTQLQMYQLTLPPMKPNTEISFNVLSIMHGMTDYGDAYAMRGLNGLILWAGRDDLRSQSWTQQVGLQGEFLQLFTPNGAQSHQLWQTSSQTNSLLTWYWLNITTPTPTGSADAATWQFDMAGMGKGQLWCNGFHVGMYWSIKDKRDGGYSQRFYHIPRDYLMPSGQANVVIVFEEAGGDPSSVVLQQRNSFDGSATISDPFAYKGNKNVASPLPLFVDTVSNQQSNNRHSETTHAETTAPAQASAGVMFFDQLHSLPYVVGYDNRTITINGQRVLIISAGIHYPRSSPSMWPQMFAAVRAAGLNCIQTYVFHNYHEYQKGVWDWHTESRNLRAFVAAAGAAGLFVNLRIGPYVCAEWFNGGQPLWTHNAGYDYRGFNPGWIEYMGSMVRYVVKYMQPYFARNGGPIFMTQIENEYGDMGTDPSRIGYVQWFSQLTVQLNTSTVWIACQEDDVPYPIIDTCNGGSCGGWVEWQYTNRQKPAMWTENWVAWFQHWGESPYWKDPREFAYEIVFWYAAGGIYMNHYMYQGGTNFGRTVGGPDITTNYDYQGALDEYGVPREPQYTHSANFYAILNKYADTLLKFNHSKGESLANGWVTAYTYGTVGTSEFIGFLLNGNSDSNFTVAVWNSQINIGNHRVQVFAGAALTLLYDTAVLPTVSSTQIKDVVVYEADTTELPSALPSSIWWFEEPVGIWSGAGITTNGPADQIDATQYSTIYMWYTTNVWIYAEDVKNGINISLSNAGDNEYFYLGERAYVGRGDGAGSGLMTYPLSIPSDFPLGGNTLSILSITQGLNNGGGAYFTRGLNGAIMWKGNDISAQQWTYQVGTLGEFLELFTTEGAQANTWNTSPPPVNAPLIWYWLNITTPTISGNPAYATWTLDMSSMMKGSVWCNGFHLGAYWLIHDAHGNYSQQYYHVPRDYLFPQGQVNSFVVLEEWGGKPESISLIQRNATKVAEPHSHNANEQRLKQAQTYRGNANVRTGDERQRILSVHSGMTLHSKGKREEFGALRPRSHVAAA